MLESKKSCLKTLGANTKTGCLLFTLQVPIQKTGMLSRSPVEPSQWQLSSSFDWLSEHLVHSPWHILAGTMRAAWVEPNNCVALEIWFQKKGRNWFTPTLLFFIFMPRCSLWVSLEWLAPWIAPLRKFGLALDPWSCSGAISWNIVRREPSIPSWFINRPKSELHWVWFLKEIMFKCL